MSGDAYFLKEANPAINSLEKPEEVFTQVPLFLRLVFTSLMEPMPVRAERSTLLGRHYQVPVPVVAVLEELLGACVHQVRVLERSWYARAHLGMTATTRRNLILIADDGEDFVSNPELMLHEYFHVVQQWNTGRLTRWRYLAESIRRGYWNNRFEQEARNFSAAMLPRFRVCIAARNAG